MLDYLLPLLGYGYAFIVLVKDWQKHKTKTRQIAAAELLVAALVVTEFNVWTSKERSVEQYAAEQAKIRMLQKSVELGNRGLAAVRQRLGEVSIQNDDLRREITAIENQNTVLKNQNNDLLTYQEAGDSLLQVEKESLPLSLREKADAIHKNWHRDVRERLSVNDSVSAR